MKLKQNVDLGAAFDLLKTALLSAEKSKSELSDLGTGCLIGYSMLSGTVQGIIDYVEDKEKRNDNDDLKEVFN